MSDSNSNSKRNYSEGYWLVKPQLGKLTVTNLVNFAEAEGAYGVTSSGILRLGKSALFFGFYVVLCIVLSAIIKNWFVSLLLWVLLFPLPFRLISLFVFDERKVKKEFKLREELKSKTDNSIFSYFFGIYDIDETFPYICYMLDGSIGVFIRCIRKTQVGNVQEKAFYHGQGLGDFYNQCAALGIVPETIDIQASNSYDERFDALYDHLNEISSPTMQTVLSSFYHHWEDNSSSSQLTYEYFLLRGTGDPMVFWDKVVALNSALMGASYKRIQTLDKEQIGTLCKDVYGLIDLPITDAMNQAVQKSDKSSLRLLWVGDAKGRKKQVNASVSEAQLKAQEQYKKQVAKQNSEATSKVKKSEKSSVSKDQGSEVLDLFADTGSDVKHASGLTGILDVEVDNQDLGNIEPKSKNPKVEKSTELNLFE